jgi:hypothetical protein
MTPEYTNFRTPAARAASTIASPSSCLRRRVRRANMEDTLHPRDRVDQAGRFPQVADNRLGGAVIPCYLCPFLITDQRAHLDASFGQLT